MQAGIFAETLYNAFRKEYSGDESLDFYIEKITQKQNLSVEEACAPGFFSIGTVKSV